MKFLAVFAAVLAVSAAYAPIASFGIEEVAAAISNPATDPAILPYLVSGLDTLMHNIYAGVQQPVIYISLPVSAEVNLGQLSDALENPELNPAYKPYLEQALNDLMFALHTGVSTVTLNIPAMPATAWSLGDLSAALEDPATDPELMVYLEWGINTLMTHIFAGESVTEIIVVIPPGVGAVPIQPPAPVVQPPSPSPVVQPPTPELVPEAVVQPVAPVATNQGPLVQLIVNVIAQGPAAAPAPAPAPVGSLVIPRQN